MTILEFILFFVAWILAQLVLDVIKAFLARKNQQIMLDEIYIKISKLTLAFMKDIKEVKRNV